jgi:O-antigen biosynthesis protein WbqV
VPSTVESLLGRAVREVLTEADRRELRGQRVLVTGAGGSVGGEIARQLAAADVAQLTLLDHSEYALFRIDAELRQSCPDLHLVAVLGDITRRPDVRAACRAAAPDVVYHAAAYKHVTFAETAVVQALRVNALGASNMARAARAAGARFVLVSSDKAARPTSVMGATKRFAEHLVLQAAAPGFRPIVVRFGNVLGSSGSVAEIMLERACAGLPLPITDPEATRYFMTGSEAASLVLKTDVIGRRPEIFWLDMGDPIRIADLAARVVEHVRAMGLPAVGVEIIGLRPGEKLHEELTSQGLSMRPTAHARILSARQRRVAPAEVNAALIAARRACARGDAAAALATLRLIVPEFSPSDAAIACAESASRRMPAQRSRSSAAGAGPVRSDTTATLV